MNQTRRRSQRSNRRSYRNRGGMAPITYSTVSENPQPSEKVMQWATTAGAPTPSAAHMRNVAHGGRRTRRRASCTCKKSCTCKRKCHCRPRCRCKKCHKRSVRRSRKH